MSTFATNKIDLDALVNAVTPTDIPEHITDFEVAVAYDPSRGNGGGAVIIYFRWKNGDGCFNRTLGFTDLIRLSQDDDAVTSMWSRSFAKGGAK